MYNSNVPDKVEIPSTKQLLKSTIWAAIISVVILIAIVMPAEYGIDPTGVGNLIGLKRMGEIKVSLNEEAAADLELDEAEESKPVVEAEPVIASGDQDESASHELEIVLEPDQSTEVKVAMSEGATVNYVWWTSGEEAIFDIHGDSKELQIDYHNYEKGKSERQEGNIAAAFDGSHGWWWRNRSPEPMTIKLLVEGDYTDIKQFD